MPGVGSGKATQKVAQAPSAQSTGVNQGTATGGFNPNAATVSYITSSVPTAADPNHIETMTEAQLNQQLISMSPQERLGWAQKLKAAGYRVGPLTGAVTKALRQSWLNAHADLQAEIQAGQQLDLTRYLNVNAGTGGTGGPSTTYTTSQINDTDARALINQVYRDQTGMDAPEDYIRKQTAALRKAQKANPTKYVRGASGNMEYSGGLNTQEFVKQDVAGTSAAQIKRKEDAYSVMLDELGGLR